MQPEICLEIARKGLPTAAYRVFLFVMGCHLNGETWIKQEYIAAELGLNEQELAQSIKVLEKQSFIERSKDSWNGIAINERVMKTDEQESTTAAYL